jgi:hypothetical protein
MLQVSNFQQLKYNGKKADYYAYRQELSLSLHLMVHWQTVLGSWAIC